MKFKTRIIQICLNIVPGDGISHYVGSLDKMFKKYGIPTQTYTQLLVDDYVSGAIVIKSARDIELMSTDIILYHMSIGTSLNSEVLQLPNRKILIFHNITPSSFMSKWDRSFENALRIGVYDIKKTVGKYESCITFSDFNKKTLVSEGWNPSKIKVVPYFNYLEELDVESDFNMLRRYNDDCINVLFVGRVVPNKRQDLLIMVTNSYRTLYKRKTRLILAGKTGFKPYHNYLKNLVSKLRIPDVDFTSEISNSQLRACYESADLFLCLSEHEGFCMPLIEAMYMNVPVIAYNTSAIAETMGGAGILLESNDPKTVTYAINRVVNDENYRNSIIQGQRKRLEELRNDSIENALMGILDPFVEATKDNSDCNSSLRSKIALVVQRYGEEINGGAELECRMLAERLSPFYDVEVLTSCVEDADTQINVYEEGISNIRGIKVQRFKAVKQRNIQRFLELGDNLNNKTDTEKSEWIDEIGPCCPDLVNYLSEHACDYKVVIFFTYLFYTSIRGLMLNLNNAVFFPTAHDEPFLYYDLFNKCFEQAKGYIYNSYEEKALVDRTFKIKGRPFCVTGVGIDIPDDRVNNNVKEKYDLPDEYVVYAGRISNVKGCNVLLQFFENYKKRNRNNIQLVMTGKYDHTFTPVNNEYIRCLGYISEEDKNGVISNARALILPSRLESLSLVVLESLYFGRPVIVNGESPVLVAHCNKSQAGLYYKNYVEFERALNMLLINKETYDKMSMLGKAYVRLNYNWNTIIAKLQAFIENYF